MKKVAKKVSKKATKKAGKKAAPKKISGPTLFVHATDSGPQLCLKTNSKGGDGVILPKDKQAELDALYLEWSKKSSGKDFMEFPKTAKWTKKLIAAFVFSKIAKKAPKKTAARQPQTKA